MRDKALDAHFTAKWVAQQARNERFKPANEYVESIPTLTDADVDRILFGSTFNADAPTREDGDRPRATVASAPQYRAVINALCDSEGIPYPSYEYRFYALRRWRFDAAWVDARCALEIEGGVWTSGRHTRGSGFVKDMEKYNAAVLQGWRVIRCLPDQLPAGVSQIAIMLTRAA